MFGKNKMRCPYIKDCSEGNKKSYRCTTRYKNCVLYKSRKSVEESETQQRGKLKKKLSEDPGFIF